MDHAIARVRRFNRIVTLRAGALQASYLGRGRPLGQARLLSEIAPEGSDMRGLRERLCLDSGYFSRLVSALARERLIVLRAGKDDRRRRTIVLTQKGAEEKAAYDRLSDDLARSFVVQLDAGQRERLVAAMAEVERLMTAASVRIGPEPPESRDAQACLAAYFAELDRRFENGFDQSLGNPGDREETQHAPRLFLIARLDGAAVGCGVLNRLDSETGEIKRMWVAPEVRGLGLSQKLLEALESEASAGGLRRVRLDTNRALAEAQALYRKAGYREIARYNDNPYAHLWFEKELRPC